jgi:hypothetical protein
MGVLNEALDEEAVVYGTIAEDTVTKFDELKTCCFVAHFLISYPPWVLDRLVDLLCAIE